MTRAPDEAPPLDAPLLDGEARRRIAEDLDSTFVVEAAAGTGKTTALIGRVIAILRTGRARLEEIVAVTFTEKAAGEMRLRLRAELERAHGAAAGEAERARFEAALAELEAARIGTIHSFCADLLRERPVEAGVDPDLEVINEDEERRLVDRAFRSWFEHRLADPPEGVRRMLRRQGTPRASLAAACRDLVGRRDHPAPWARPDFDRDRAIDAQLEELRGLAALASLASARDDYLARDLARIARFVSDVDERERVRPRDYDGLEAGLAALRRDRECWAHRGYGHFYGEGLSRSDVLSRRAATAEKLDAFLALAEADLAACVKRDLGPVVEAYERLEARTGTLDFLDLLIKARDLIASDARVRAELRARTRCIFVDEFQDTDPLQAEILLMLASDGPLPPEGMLSDDAPPPAPGKLFVVGDPKQSVYRFRRADVGLYERIKRRLLGQGVTLLHLSTSFRAPPDIQRVVNAAFAPLMQGAEDGSQASYVPLSEHRPAPAGRPSVVALPVPLPYGRWGKIFKKHVEESTADAVGAFVDWLLNESGWTVEDPLEHVTRPIESRDVCLLFRSTVRYRRSVVAPYVLALEARNLPHVLVGGRAFHDREEVLALANVLRAIEHPRDTLSVYAVLRGPLVALSDEQLLLHREAVGSLDPLVPHEDEIGDPVAAALAILRELHRARNRRPIADTLARFLDATRAHAGVAHWPNGEQALANVLRVLELARRFEAQGATSFRGFVEHLDERLERGEGVDAPVVEERAAGVRVMTVHKAKGLEMPVVVLCDPSLPRTVERPSRYVDSANKLWAAPLAGCAPHELHTHRDAVIRADEAEEVRLAYVAATRARDLLVVPCVGDDPVDGWVDPLHAALYPADGARRASEPAPGCPAFGEDTVLERPPEARRGAERAVRPGLHRVGEGGEAAEVVWWDPSALGLGRVPRGGLRRTALLAPKSEGAAGPAQIEAHLEWIARRAAVGEAGAAVSWRVRPVTAVAHEAVAQEALGQAAAAHTVYAPEIVTTDAPREGRPGGTRFGTLVHAVLAECRFDADGAALAAMARHQGRLLDAPPEEIEAATVAARAALAHPLMERARAAHEQRSEVPITVPLDDGTSAEGVIDLAFRDDEGWTVVDFKTDRETGEKLVHAVQLDVYARAVAAATKLPVRAVLFYV